ncbi:MAG: hypothetical protein ACYCY6_02120 [Minisyncoccota bacterium]
MNKVLHIIPGWEDSCKNEQYQKLVDAAKARGYEAVCHDVDWKKPLSKQIFAVGENDAVFGFSLGAVLAWLIAQRHVCGHLILASTTLHKSFSDPDDIKALTELAGSEFVNDIIKNLSQTNKAKRQTVMYGALEGELADILVPNTEHELSDAYIEEVSKLL